MPVSQSIVDSAATSLIASMLPKAPMDVVMSQAIGVQAKAAGIGTAAEKGVDIARAAIEVRTAAASWPKDDPLLLKLEAMFGDLTDATGTVAKQAAEMKLPK